MSADDYYGPNANLRAALAKDANTWRMIHREAAGNRLQARAIRGRLVCPWPLEVEADAGQAEVEITGGLAFVPLTFTGLDTHAGWQLWRQGEGDGQAVRVRQDVHGNDYWQANFDAERACWTLTYNVPLDTPHDRPEKVRFLLKKGSP
jgi:hypothetical protein